MVYNRKFIDVDVDARVLVELPLRAHEREPRGHRTTGACSNESPRVEDEHAAARARVGQLHGAELLGRVVRVAAARGDVVQVERQRDARALDGDGLGELRCAPESERATGRVTELRRTVTTLTSRGTYHRKRS